MDKQNEKTSELTAKQMENVTGGGLPHDPGNNNPNGSRGKDCFYCPGVYINHPERKCGLPLTLTSSGAYRCENGLCSLFLKDQHPSVK